MQSRPPASRLRDAGVTAVILVTALITTPMQGAQPRRDPCTGPNGRELRIPPQDDAAQRPDFLEFRRHLQEAVVRRDANALVPVIDPDVKVAFDGSGGIEDFRKYHLDNPEQDFWEEFARVLTLGGTFRRPDEFVAPYTFSEWPDAADSFECLAVTGTRVRLRQAPGTGSRILATLDYSIVERAQDSSQRSQEWMRVRRADGTTGYMSIRYLRSPVDYRVAFALKNGEWKLVFYVAGD